MKFKMLAAALLCCAKLAQADCYSEGVRVGTVQKFSVIDAAIAKNLDTAVMSGADVALKYCQTLLPMLDSSTGYRITQVVIRK